VLGDDLRRSVRCTAGFRLALRLGEFRQLIGDLSPTLHETHLLMLPMRGLVPVAGAGAVACPGSFGRELEKSDHEGRLWNPAGPRITMAERPPGRRSCSMTSVVQGFGHHHSSRRSVQTLKTVSGGASMKRSTESSNGALRDVAFFIVSLLALPRASRSWPKCDLEHFNEAFCGSCRLRYQMASCGLDAAGRMFTSSTGTAAVCLEGDGKTDGQTGDEHQDPRGVRQLAAIGVFCERQRHQSEYRS